MVVPSFVVLLKVRDWLLHAQEHGNHGKKGKEHRTAVPQFFLAFELTPVLTPAGDLRPRPADYSCLQTGERRSGVLRTRGAQLHCSVLPEQTCWHAEAPPRVPHLWIPSNLFARLVVTIESSPPTILGRFISAVVALSDWLNMQQHAAWFWPAQSFFFSSSQGSVAIAGAVVRWLRDNLGIIKSSAEIGSLFIMSKLFSNHAVIMQISLKDFFCPHCLRDTGSNSWNVLWLLLCSCFLWTLRPLLGAKCKRVKQLSKHVTHSCGRDNGHGTSPGSVYKWWKWSRLQNYLWPHPVHQQEPLGLCRPRGRLLPDQRGEDHLPLCWGDRWRKHWQNSGILGIHVVNIVKTAEYIQMSM